MPSTTQLAAAAALLLLLLCCACAPAMPIDPSMPATTAGDATLLHSACGEQLGHGYDLCRVKDGAEIVERWVLVLPWAPDFIDGEVSIRYRDQTHVFPVTGPTLEIPWSLLVGAKAWSPASESPAQARAVLKFNAADGPRWVDLLGYAFPIVLKQGYDPLPLDSGRNFTELTCRLQYTTAGRSALQCQP